MRKARKTINLYNKNLNVSNYDSSIKKEQSKRANEMAERRKNEKD